MKKRFKKVLLPLSLVGMLVLGSTSVFANTNDTIISSHIETNTDFSIPYLMEPGSILTFDENLNPIVLKGGFVDDNNNTSIKDKSLEDYLFYASSNLKSSDLEQINLENELATEMYTDILNNNYEQVNSDYKIYPGMVVVYDENTGQLNNFYYVDENEESGYSTKEPVEVSELSIISPKDNKTWSWGTNNVLTYQQNSDSFLGTGRATYFTGTYGNRDNKLKNNDVATQKNYDYSKKGDQDITIRNLDNDITGTYYQADVGGLPNAIIDIWGLSNLQKLADNSNVTSIPNVRYYHKRFSDQARP